MKTSSFIFPPLSFSKPLSSDDEARHTFWKSYWHEYGKQVAMLKGNERLFTVHSSVATACGIQDFMQTNVLSSSSAFGCSRRSDLSALCSEISGDAPLYWLFRADGHSVACPFFHHRHEGDDGGDGVDGLLLASSLSFSYDRGKGGCEWPLSAVRACTRASAVALHYQACPNVKGSEMMSESPLECRILCTRYSRSQIRLSGTPITGSPT